MRKIFNLLLSFLLGLIIFSCEKEANVKLPKAPPKLVVYSFISPQDSIVTVKVTQTIPVFRTTYYSSSDPEIKWLDNALVKISKGSIETILHYNSEAERYETSSKTFSIEPGQTYFLTVFTAEGLSVDAQCTVPISNNSLKMQIDTIKSSKTDEYDSWNLMINWKQMSPSKNYFMFYAQGELNKSINPEYPNDKIFFIRMEDDFTFLIPSETSGIFSKKNLFTNYISPTDKDTARLTSISAVLFSVDEPYYRYHEWESNHEDDNPFAEPTLPYTNINGGLGVFGSYNKTCIRQDLK